jgi:hypothetical protein
VGSLFQRLPGLRDWAVSRAIVRAIACKVGLGRTETLRLVPAAATQPTGMPVQSVAGDHFLTGLEVVGFGQVIVSWEG